ncbi:MAG: MBL fold metallo-hydrolase, partial [Halobacteria archaeon]|nr:MBL fold metallo-hydrolase [Halobacteria archaeon]
MDKLADGVWRLELKGVNAYLVDDSGTLTLVDAGTPFDAGSIREQVEEAGYSVSDIDRVLITHYDFDHVGALPRLELDAPVYAGETDARFLSGESKPPLSNHKGFFQRLVGVFIGKPDLRIETVGEGYELGGFTAYTTPGHTPDHTAFVHEKLGVGFLGDMVAGDDGKLTVLNRLLQYNLGEVH